MLSIYFMIFLMVFATAITVGFLIWEWRDKRNASNSTL